MASSTQDCSIRRSRTLIPARRMAPFSRVLPLALVAITSTAHAQQSPAPAAAPAAPPATSGSSSVSQFPEPPGASGAASAQPVPSAPPPAFQPATSVAAPAAAPGPTPAPGAVVPTTPPAGHDSFASPADADSTPRKATEWYGLPLVVVDGLSFAVIGIGRAAESEDATMVGVASGMLNGLVVHTFSYPSRQQGTGLAKGFLSLLMRGGLGIGTCALGSDCFEQHLSDGALARLAGGLLVAAVLDDAFLAKRTISTGASSTAVQIGPTASGGPGVFQFGAAGSF
jgi:hypothetical protein